MATLIKQIRYYGDKDERNYPSGLGYLDLAGSKASGTAFSNYLPCKILKIKGPSGLKLFLNGKTGTNDGILIGDEGIYQIENYEVYALRFDPGKKSSGKNKTARDDNGLQNIFSADNAIREPYLFIDFIYETED